MFLLSADFDGRQAYRPEKKKTAMSLCFCFFFAVFTFFCCLFHPEINTKPSFNLPSIFVYVYISLYFFFFFFILVFVCIYTSNSIHVHKNPRLLFISNPFLKNIYFKKENKLCFVIFHNIFPFLTIHIFCFFKFYFAVSI